VKHSVPLISQVGWLSASLGLSKLPLMQLFVHVPCKLILLKHWVIV